MEIALLSIEHDKRYAESSPLRAGFTLIELLVVVTIIVALLAILLPSMNNAVAIATQTNCLAGQRQINIGLLTYTSDNFGFFADNPGSLPCNATRRSGWLGWYDYRPLLTPYVSDTSVYYCPDAIGKTATPHRDNQAEFIGGGHIGNEAGWDAIPLNVPADRYVWIDYAIFAGYRNAHSNKTPTILLAPNEPIHEVPEFMSDPDSLATVPNRLSDASVSPASIPMTADAVWGSYTLSLEIALTTPPIHHDIPSSDAYTYRAFAHFGGAAGFRGVGTTFMDGSAAWRGPDVAGPRISVRNGTALTNYNLVFWY